MQLFRFKRMVAMERVRLVTVESAKIFNYKTLRSNATGNRPQISCGARNALEDKTRVQTLEHMDHNACLGDCEGEWLIPYRAC
jgi:hypothetical protein